MPEDELVTILADPHDRFRDRHLNVEGVLENHFEFVFRESHPLPRLTRDR
jgi:hypothetical protein